MKQLFLTIAASDPSSGAGIQRDLQVADHHGFWGMNVITALTAQNLNQVKSLYPVDIGFLKEQLDLLFSSYNFQTIKIGVIPSVQAVRVIAEYIREVNAPVILDPVFRSSSLFSFSDQDVTIAIRELLLPYCSIITPNKDELEILVHQKISHFEEAVQAAKETSFRLKTAIYLKGGHFPGDQVEEALINANSISRFTFPRKHWPYSHGTGCVFSSALACNAVTEEFMDQAVVKAHQYLDSFFSQANKQKIIPTF